MCEVEWSGAVRCGAVRCGVVGTRAFRRRKKHGGRKHPPWLTGVPTETAAPTPFDFANLRTTCIHSVWRGTFQPSYTSPEKLGQRLSPLDPAREAAPSGGRD